jgi:hypothetical protein
MYGEMRCPMIPRATLLGAAVRWQPGDAHPVPTLDPPVLARPLHRFLPYLATNVQPINRFVDFTDNRPAPPDDAESTWTSWIIV